MTSTAERHSLLPNHNTAYHTLTVHDTHHANHTPTTRHPRTLSCQACLQHAAHHLLTLAAATTFAASLVLALLAPTTAHYPHPLPVPMALMGAAGLAWLLAVPAQQWLEESASPAWEATCCRLTWLTRLACLVTLLVCSVVQSVWVFGSEEAEWRGGADGGGGVVNGALLYEFAWWFLVVWWSLLGLCILGSCCLCLLCCRAFFLS